jgi:hypothetical protein
MQKLILEVNLDTEHPHYRTPENAYDLLNALENWAPTAGFQWKIGDEPLHGEIRPHDYTSAAEAACKRNWFQRFWDAIPC